MNNIYKKFFSNAPHPMFIMNTNGLIIELNPQAAILFKVSPSNHKPLYLKEILSPECLIELDSKLGTMEFNIKCVLPVNKKNENEIRLEFIKEKDDHLYIVNGTWMESTELIVQRNFYKEAHRLSQLSTFLYDPKNDLFIFIDSLYHDDPSFILQKWQTLTDFLYHFPLEQRKYLNDEFNRCSNEKVQVDFESQFKFEEEGLNYWMKINLSPLIDDESSSYVLGIFQNIDQLKKVQLKLMNTNIDLQRQKIFYQTLIDQIPLAITCQSAVENYQYTLWNKMAEAVFSKKSSEVIGKSPLEIGPKELAERNLTFDKDIINRNETYYLYENEWKNDGNLPFWLRTWKIPIKNMISGEKFLASVYLDITDIKQKQDYLKESRDQLYLAVKNSSGGIWDWNLETKQVYYSSHFKRLIGFENENIEENVDFFFNLLHLDDKVKVSEGFYHHLKYRNNFDQEFRLKCIDGKYRWFLGRGQALWEGSKAYRMVGSLIDIHEQKLSSMELINQRKRSEANAKMATLGQASGSMVHEISNPLAIIYAFSERVKGLLAAKNLDLKEIEKCHLKIENTIGRISTIVNGMRNFSKEDQESSFELINVESLIKESLLLVEERVAKTKVKLSIEDHASGQILGRNTQLSQVILNLVNNSIDEIEKMPEPWIKVKLQSDQSFYFITIVDSGLGIEEEKQDLLFRMFYTTKPKGVGTGLGLSISKKIMTNHQGDLYYEKHDGNTAFTLKLPRASESKKAS